jgi:AcrR family transcriptional regulator
VTAELTASDERFPRRAARARATKRRIVDAAIDGFTTAGYAPTSIASVARAAGVGTQTVYAAFGNKASILAAAVDLAIAGDDEAVAVNERDWMRAVLAEHDPEQRLRRYATAITRIQSGAARVFRVLDLAAGDSPELEALWRETMRRRRVGVTGIVGPIADAGVLRAGLDAATAIDIVWSLNGHEVFLNLVDHCGWSAARYGEWLGDTLVELLLADGRGD